MHSLFIVPAQILKISKTRVRELNVNLTLTCDVVGDPAPIISWTRENYSTPLTPPKFELSDGNRSLIITNITLSDRGRYICVAKNEHNVDRRNVSVTLKGIPIVIHLSTICFNSKL